MRFVGRRSPAAASALSMEAIDAPARSGLWRELRLVRELPRLGCSLPFLARLPKGIGDPVLLLPGYGADDRALAPLGAFLRWLGHRTYGWELGKNRGDVPALLPRVLERVEQIRDQSDRPITLLGWSLGGVLAREVARDRPELVRRVITLGTPVVGGPTYTVVADRYRRRGFDLDLIASEVAERNRVPIQRPITAIYSRRDAIVAWKACIDCLSPEVENLEVNSSHLGLLLDPMVFRAVAKALALRTEALRTERTPAPETSAGRTAGS